MMQDNIITVKYPNLLSALVADTIMGVRCYVETRGPYNLCVVVGEGEKEPWERVRIERVEREKERYRLISCAEAVNIGFYGSGIPRFSESVSESWKVVKKMSELGYGFRLATSGIHRLARADAKERELPDKFKVATMFVPGCDWNYCSVLPTSVCVSALCSFGVKIRLDNRYWHLT